jgi:hypothetical protein
MERGGRPSRFGIHDPHSLVLPMARMHQPPYEKTVGYVIPVAHERSDRSRMNLTACPTMVRVKSDAVLANIRDMRV